MHILGIIPARGGSKRVKDKNILLIKGKPLIGYTIEDALSSRLMDKVVVSTDSDQITKVVKSAYDIEVIKRPSEFARDDSPIEEGLLHAIEYLAKEKNYSPDIVVWMSANIPIRKEGAIDQVIEKLCSSDADSCITCRIAQEVPEVMRIINEQGLLVPLQADVAGTRWQEFPQRYVLIGSIVALRTQNLFKTRGIRKAHIYLGERVIPVIQENSMYSLEVDNPDEVDLLEYYLERLDYFETKNLRSLSGS
ncbi:MAG: acylneuraminate cytidylyltransferase family protein [Planctomycetes bacterium]|nr:acylneuraminate cytidylyltransferase family protein [Planctomycetota bacterium]